MTLTSQARKNKGNSYFVNHEVIPDVSACPGVKVKTLKDSCITKYRKDDKLSFANEFAWKLWLYRDQNIDFEFKD